MMICKSSNTFHRFGNDWILPKNLWLKEKSTKTKNYTINYARYTKLKNNFLWFTLGHVTYENIKIKLWSSISILTARHVEIFCNKKKNDCKFQLRFVKCCTLFVTKGDHTLLSPLNRLVRCYFIMFRMYIIRNS